MAQYTQHTQQPTDRTSFNPMAYSQISNQPQIHERRSRQQPDQSSGSHELTKIDNKPSDNVAEVAQGLKELQEKINSALKRSSSSTPIRPNQNVSALPRVPSFKPVQTEIEPERSQKLYESYYEARSAASANPSQPATAKYAPSDMKSSMVSKGVSESFSASQSYSSRFYLGGQNSNVTEQERLLNSIKNYQVKTLHNLNSSRSIQSAQTTYTQQTPLKKTNQTLGSSAILSSPSFIPINGFQPSFDTQQLDHVISRIMSSNQSFNGLRQGQESFVTNQDSYLMAKVNESNVTQDQIRRTSQQSKQSRPIKQSQPISHINPRKPTTASQQTKKPKDPKSSCCGEIELDGDSMILEFIKGNDQLFVEDDEDEGPAAKRARAVEEDKPQPKKLSKRQEILNSKRQQKGVKSTK